MLNSSLQLDVDLLRFFMFRDDKVNDAVIRIIRYFWPTSKQNVVPHFQNDLITFYTTRSRVSNLHLYVYILETLKSCMVNYTIINYHQKCFFN